ncbi:MAG: leucyl/phenylalanyl-tRNA--protein transferase [Proteobacteria bacterium]|nr:leucyl/phenylalanyl-tRNA--protein transferase [Pseudomonadota bacterium]
MHLYSPETIIKSYALGVFPMAKSRDDHRIFFVNPKQRGIIPLAPPRLTRSMRRLLRHPPYRLTINRGFAHVVDGCLSRPETWINPPIRQMYLALHRLGFAHSIETWRISDNPTTPPQLVGGIFGIALGGAFFGESMYSTATNASKLALLQLIARLIYGGFTLFDVQFTTPHLKQFGARDISRHQFQKHLEAALMADAHMPLNDNDGRGKDMFLQLLHERTLIS